jgi:hypothetical protein
MSYIIMVDDLDTGMVEAYREHGKVVMFDSEWDAVGQKYLLLDSPKGRNKRYDIRYVKDKVKK